MTERKKSIRKPPSYQEYASDILASAAYRMMSLPERGLWDTLRKEFWVNGPLPSDLSELSKLLRFSSEELEKAYTSEVKSFFEIHDDKIVCPELKKYRESLESRDVKQADGGREGGLKTQKNRREALAKVEGSLKDDLKPLSRGELIRDEGGGEEVSRVFNTKSTDEWINDYDNAPDAF